jgi:hypothetical protein
MDASGEWNFTFLKLLVSIQRAWSIGKGCIFVKMKSPFLTIA